jgi:hypothetical protein
MTEAYLDDHETLQSWRRASRVPAKLGRPKKRKPMKRRGRAEAAPSP